LKSYSDYYTERMRGMNTKKYVEKLKDIHSNIADDVWPDGWDMECKTCGKVIHLTKEECGYCLAHGWPKCCGHDMLGISSKS